MREGPALRHVAVADRVPVLGEVGRDRLLQFEPCEPEPRGRVRGNDPCGRTGRKRQLVIGCDGAERLFHDPIGVGIATRRRGGESELELRAVGARRGHGRCEGGGRVDDKEVARGE
jgi:hypothetical protein